MTLKIVEAYKLQLTMDGLRLTWKGQQLNFQKEHSIVQLYCRSAGFLVEQHN